MTGCLVEAEPYETRRATLLDDDGDGQTEVEGDCADDNASVWSGAPERCNGFDDNCDGAVDEPAEGNDGTWAADADGDGFAPDDAVIYTVCASPGDGWVATFGDCDDGSAAAYPGASERCDGADNDCDGASDEEPTVDPPTWYADGDGDGYGDASQSVSQCAAPTSSGWVSDATDCEDADASVHPGAPELCNGGDDDCDGAMDDPPVTGDASWYPDLDGDGYGDASGAACGWSEGYISQAGDCDDGDRLVHPGVEEVCNDGVDNNCDGSPNACEWAAEVDLTGEYSIETTQTEDYLGYSAAWGDLDGDGAPEIALGSCLTQPEDSGERTGKISVFELPLSGRTVQSADAPLSYWGSQELAVAGSSVLIHDVDGDGQDDLQAGSLNGTTGLAFSGALYTMYGPLSGGGGELAAAADWTLVGSEEDEQVGARAYTFGDINGDGRSDFGTGYEFRTYNGEYECGGVYIFTSSGTGSEAASDAATAFIYGSEENDEIGLGATGADLDGDGYSDVVVGAEGYEYGAVSGAALVFFGPLSGDIAGDDADVVLHGENYVSLAGRKVDRLGDGNGDGLDDLIVGSPQAGEGAAYVVWGSSSFASASLADAQVKIRSDRENKHLGYSVDGIGDLNEDGWPDLFVSEGNVVGDDPQSYVFFGPFDVLETMQSSDADVTFAGDESDDIYEVAFTPGDATGDGVPDLVLGSYKHGASSWDGIVYVAEGTGY
jgi:hypothetical protein